ncbi:MAG: pyridoxamine 5'-phosphate oxidase family protein [Pseudomonadota bacterium]
MPQSMEPATFDAFLDSKPGWIVLTTIDGDGFPHSVPLGYFRDGDRVYCGVRDHTQKIRNIEKNPKVSLMVEAGSTMQDIKGAMIQGVATIHREPESVLRLMRLGASARGVAEADLPTAANPGSAFIEVAVHRRISWDYGAP